MRTRLLHWLRCPRCGATLGCTAFEETDDQDVETGLLACETGHLHPVVGGVPRMLPDAVEEHHSVLRPEDVDARTP
jgi:uncharacterized protein YbaR (Trm112 family)